MAKEYAKSFYNSGEWRRARKAYYRKRHGLCERCGEPGRIVHHRIPITPENISDPSITLSEDNFELVCYDCHNSELEKEPARFSFGPGGSVGPPKNFLERGAK